MKLRLTLDQLIRRERHQNDLPPLEVVDEDGALWCMSNRRLTELKWLQAVQQDKAVGARCVIHAPSPRYRQRRSSMRDVLGICPSHTHNRVCRIWMPRSSTRQHKHTLAFCDKHPEHESLDTFQASHSSAHSQAQRFEKRFVSY